MLKNREQKLRCSLFLYLLHAMKILVIRFSSIGDIVLTTPVVRCLKKQIQAEVHYLTKHSYQSILQPNPYIDKIYSIKEKVSEVLADLKSEQYDYVIDLHSNIRSQQVKTGLRKPSQTFNKINLAKWLIVNLKIDRLPDVHIVDRYLKTTQSLNIENDGAGLDYFIPKKDEVDLSDLGITTSFTAFAIGAAHATKRLPTSKIIEICKQVDRPIVLLGGPTEKPVGEEIAQAAGENVVNTCGMMNLHQSASIVRQATKVITHDTGMMHIAAAFQKEIISVWGNTIPQFGMYPYFGKGSGVNHTIEVSGLSCRPCSKIGYAKCPKKHFNCMNQIDVQKIVSIANR